MAGINKSRLCTLFRGVGVHAFRERGSLVSLVTQARQISGDDVSRKVTATTESIDYAWIVRDACGRRHLLPCEAYSGGVVQVLQFFCSASMDTWRYTVPKPLQFILVEGLQGHLARLLCIADVGFLAELGIYKVCRG